MIKIRLYIIFYFLFSVCAYSNANEIFNRIELTPEQRLWVRDNPVFTATNQTNYAPIDYVENSKTKGFSSEYLKLAAQKVGLNITFISSSNWSELIDKVFSGEIDVVHSITQSSVLYPVRPSCVRRRMI